MIAMQVFKMKMCKLFFGKHSDQVDADINEFFKNTKIDLIISTELKCITDRNNNIVIVVLICYEVLS